MCCKSNYKKETSTEKKKALEINAGRNAETISLIQYRFLFRDFLPNLAELSNEPGLTNLQLQKQGYVSGQVLFLFFSRDVGRFLEILCGLGGFNLPCKCAFGHLISITN